MPSDVTERIASREAWIGSAAAAWTRTSAPSTRRAAAAGSRTSPRSSSTPRSSSASSSGARSSVRTSCPSASSRRARCRPRKPAPPEIAHRIDHASEDSTRAARTGPLRGRQIRRPVRGRAGVACSRRGRERRKPPDRGAPGRPARVRPLRRADRRIAGPATVRATKAFQRRAGLVADGRAGPATRRALGPLGAPLFGRRTLRRRIFGWDVSVLQFMLARRGALVPVYGFFDARHRAGAAALSASAAARDGWDRRAGHALTALGRGRPGVRLVRRSSRLRRRACARLLDHWARSTGSTRPRPGSRVDGVRLPAWARLVLRRARRDAGAAEHARRTSSRC